VYTYQPEMQWDNMNMLATIGAFLMGVGFLMFVVNVAVSRKTGLLAGPNPWGAGTLEWATASPPPTYNFLDLPTVGGREPLWENAPDQPFITGLREDIREVLVTKPLDADPGHREIFPEPSIWPFLAAVATGILFIWSIFSPWGVVWGAIPLAITLTGWFWPSKRSTRLRREQEKWENATSRA
jgi:cytochrome c oxidase subunit 1